MDLVSNPNEDDGPKILGVTLPITAAALMAVAARVYVRSHLIRNFGIDDALMTFSVLISVAGGAVMIPQVRNGAGRHRGDVEEDVFGLGVKLNFVTQLLYLCGICNVKLSVGCSLLRIASKNVYKQVIMCIMTFMTLYTSACFITVLAQCTDIRVLWDKSVDSVCWPVEVLQGLGYANVTINILTDLLFATIPIPMLWRLNIHRRARISLVVILGLGVFACAAACVKSVYIVNYGKLGDVLWDSRNITIWTVAEMNIGIVAGSLPTLRPLFKRFLGSTYGKASKSPAETGYYAHRELRSNNWRALSSSEEALNALKENHELQKSGWDYQDDRDEGRVFAGS
ncbi:hypothetical protein CkaCkLH20_03407 [Colletotrichum karsti]|uniref:Rhodopsin domain-containing protein n=1 Tax=Colletotrichum karsti TaxID=1095194 RepID=A0A9P6IAZ1_9PEZI|nr:uncharacterized protein CkaCkLH20_03407 [Colletotrichum karsti]KAF9879174.1 hypothetical protein CkaCkLH20_03407 [Colletotrichum karsti]